MDDLNSIEIYGIAVFSALWRHGSLSARRTMQSRLGVSQSTMHIGHTHLGKKEEEVLAFL